MVPAVRPLEDFIVMARGMTRSKAPTLYVIPKRAAAQRVRGGRKFWKLDSIAKYKEVWGELKSGFE